MKLDTLILSGCAYVTPPTCSSFACHRLVRGSFKNLRYLFYADGDDFSWDHGVPECFWKATLCPSGEVFFKNKKEILITRKILLGIKQVIQSDVGCEFPLYLSILLWNVVKQIDNADLDIPIKYSSLSKINWYLIKLRTSLRYKLYRYNNYVIHLKWTQSKYKQQKLQVGTRYRSCIVILIPSL